MNEKFCSNCGENLTPGSKFCPRCGRAVGQQNVNRPVNNSQANWQNVNRTPGNRQNPTNNPQAVWQPVNQNPNNNVHNNNHYNGNSYNNNSFNNNLYNNPGTSQRPQPPVQQPVNQNITKAQYRKMCTNEKYLKDLKNNAIILYVVAGITALLAFAGNTAALLDVAIVLGLTLGMHLGKNKGCAIGVLVYSICSMLLNLIAYGSLGGWLVLIASIGAIKCFSIADQEYESRFNMVR